MRVHFFNYIIYINVGLCVLEHSTYTISLIAILYHLYTCKLYALVRNVMTFCDGHRIFVSLALLVVALASCVSLPTKYYILCVPLLLVVANKLSCSEFSQVLSSAKIHVHTCTVRTCMNCMQVLYMYVYPCTHVLYM